MANTRSYTYSIAGGTATATIQIQAKGTLHRCIMSAVDAAAGTWELSLSGTSQIGTTAPTKDVLGRLRLSGTAGQRQATFELSVPVVAFQNIYLHCTGAGNVGDVTIVV